MKTTISQAYRSVEIQFSEATVYLSGEFAGNIEVSVRTGGELTRQDVEQHLRARVPGELNRLEPVDPESDGDEICMTFFSAEVSNSGQMPSAVELVWVNDQVQALGQLTLKKARAEELPEISDDASLPGDHSI